MDLIAQAREARALAGRGRHREAVLRYRRICAEAHVVDEAYDGWLRAMATAYRALGQPLEAALVTLYLGEFEEALLLLGQAPHGGVEPVAGVDPSWLPLVQSLAGQHLAAGAGYQGAGRQVLAAIAFEKGGRDEAARACWERAAHDGRLQQQAYVEALVHFNLGYCCLRLRDEAGHGHLVTAQRLLEEAADEFETAGQRERAFDCCQILLEMGRRSAAFENLAEGYLNCIRILKEDNLKFYALQYYEDFLQEAARRQEYHAAATLYREAAEYCLRTGLIYEPHYVKAAAEHWLLAAQKNSREEGPPELSENAYLAAVDCYNTLGDYQQIGEAYRRLSLLDLHERKRARYARVAARYREAPAAATEAPPFPSYLKQAHAYPEIWHLDLVEWEHDGDVGAICAQVAGDRSYPDVVRRRALLVLLEHLDQEGRPAGERLAAVAEGLGDLQVYVVLRPLERLFEHPEGAVQRGVMRALRYLFFKRTFGLLADGLRAADAGVRQAAIEALGRLHFNHAFDPLVRIFREIEDPEVQGTALQSIGRIPTLEAGDFLIEALRYESEPLRGLARQLLVEFDNRELLPILQQHHAMESGPRRADLEEVLRRLGGL